MGGGRGERGRDENGLIELPPGRGSLPHKKKHRGGICTYKTRSYGTVDVQC